MTDIRDYGVTVEEYLESWSEGIDLLELKRLESCGIPTELALECMTITQKIIEGTSTPEDIVRGLMILTPSMRPQLKDSKPEDTLEKDPLNKELRSADSRSHHFIEAGKT